jgi:hypothetical protein
VLATGKRPCVADGATELLRMQVHEPPPPPRKLAPQPRLLRHLSLALRTLPYEMGLRKACIGFRNVPDAH